MDNRTAPASESRTPVSLVSPVSPVSGNGKLLTILGTSARIEGKFQIAESIEVQCEISGELAVGGTLVIGDRGRVAADVTTVNAVIIGTYTGNLKASGSVEVAATGRVSGSVQSNELVIAKGAVFTGSVAHIEKEQPRAQQQVRSEQTRSAVAQPAPAPFTSDLQTDVPVARLIEIDVGDTRETRPSSSPETPSRSRSSHIS